MDSNSVARLDEVGGFTDLFDALDALSAAYPSARLLCTLDDLDQCAYTSMHATGRLEDDQNLAAEPYDHDDAAAVHRAQTTTTAAIATLLDNPATQIDWEMLRNARIADDHDLDALVTLNDAPDRALDDVVLIQRVAVDRDDLAIAAIPNGYFTGDWNIFANHAVIRRMAGHGYRHLAIGAALLAFIRPAAPDPEEAAATVTDLVHLYGSPDAIAWHELAALLPTRRLLILGYAEDFGDALDVELPGTT